jgi:hypothetical protein
MGLAEAADSGVGNGGTAARAPQARSSRMHSSMIGKIEKAHRYAQEPERVTFNSLSATFRGGHDEYVVEYGPSGWTCSCHTFETHVVGTCSHIMALQQILRPMLAPEARFSMATQSEAEATV